MPEVAISALFKDPTYSADIRTSFRAGSRRPRVWGCVVSGARPDGRASRPIGYHFDLPERAVELRIRGTVLDDVLAADVVRYLLADLLDGAQLFGMVRGAAARFGDGVHGAGRPLGFPLLFF